MLAPALSSAALASRLRLSGTLALDPDLGVRLQGFQSLARELVQENAPSASETKSEQAVLAIVAHLANRPSAAEGFGFSNTFVQSGARSMLRRDLRRRAVRIAGSAAANPVARIPVPTPVPVPVPVVFDLRFGSRANLGFVASDFDTLGDTADGVQTADVSGPTVYAAIWLPAAAPDPLTILRDDLSVPNLFVVGPTVLELGGIPGRYWRTSAPFRRWSASRLDVRFPA